MILKEKNNIPSTAGVYLFKNIKGKVIYIGKALNLKERINSYFHKSPHLKIEKLRKEAINLEYIQVFSEIEALILEANLIKLYQPKYNINLRDDKSFLYIIISKEKYPRILAVRKNDIYPVKYKFGPYPSSQNVRQFLKLIRKIFPFCTQSNNAKRPCFYSHIKLCNPCPYIIESASGQEQLRLRRIYYQNINNIRKFLEGKLSNIINYLYKDMKKLSQISHFEEANKIYQTIKQIDYIRQPQIQIKNYLSNPNYLEDSYNKIEHDLKIILKTYYPKTENINKIEGVDISNLSGQQSTGSLVVFIKGQKYPKLFRHFKLNSKGPNDVQMVKELLEEE